MNSVFDPSNSVESVYLVATRSYSILLCLFEFHILTPCVIDLHAFIFGKIKTFKVSSCVFLAPAK